MTEMPLVSAVIPTRNRPELVCRAVRSALNQTYTNLEVVVVVDGPDQATVEALEALQEPRLRVVQLTDNVGGSEARNVGAREARGEWIALLDDDDEWMKDKLCRQMEAIRADKCDALFIASAYYQEAGHKLIVQPKRFPQKGINISNYLFCQVSLLGRRLSFLQTSTWIVRRDFMLRHPFTKGLKKNQDTDWLLRHFSKCGDRSYFVKRPLSVFHEEPNIKRVSTTQDWKYSYQWLKDNRQLFTEKAAAYFLMTDVARSAIRQEGAGKSLFRIWKNCPAPMRIHPRIIYFLTVRLLLNLLVVR